MKESWDGTRRATPRYGGDHASGGERNVLHGGSGAAARQEDRKPGRRLGVSSVLRRRVRQAGDGDHVLRLAPSQDRSEPLRDRGGFNDGAKGKRPCSPRLVGRSP